MNGYITFSNSNSIGFLKVADILLAHSGATLKT